MIYLNEYEGKSIEITYNGGHGRMTVNLMQFLDNQPLTKIRKLIDLIRVSDNPDAEETFKNYCTEWLKRYEHFNEQVKEKRDELSLYKSRASTHLSDFKKNERIKEKYEKVLDYINQGR